jgi:superfamily II DNA helicase RecQ
MDICNRHHIALIISPLRSLMMDQVRIWIARGIRCAAVMAGMDEATLEGMA